MNRKRPISAVSLILAAFALAAAAVSAQPVSNAASVTTADGVLRFTANPTEGTVTVQDLLNQVTMSESLVCPAPTGLALTPDEVSLLVVCQRSGELVFVNTAHLDVVARVAGVGAAPTSLKLSPDGRNATLLNASGSELRTVDIERRRLFPDPPSAARDPKASAQKAPKRPSRRNQVVFIGAIHGEHRTSDRFGIDLLHKLVVAISPDYVLTEIPPNRLERAAREFAATGRIAEPRVSRFPEYVDVLFPMSGAARFQIIGTAAWNQPMDRFRRNRLAAIERDPERARDWAEYQAAIKASGEALARGGASDDPRWIHTDAYDAAQRIALDVYNRLFDKDLGTGGWDTINKAHFANMARTLDEHSGEGVRFLAIYGAGHKSWMLRRLREREDLDVLDISEFLDRVAAPR